MESDLKEKDFSEVVKSVPGNELHGLLEAASNMNFEGDDGYTKIKGEFEKVSSLFDLVKNEAEKKEDTTVEESTLKEDGTDSEELSNILVEESSENEFGEPVEQLGNEPYTEEGTDPDLIVDNNDKQIVNSDEFKNPGAITLEDSAEVSEDQPQDDEIEIEQENEKLSDEDFDQYSYDRGYKEALIEFEKTIEQEKNDFLNVANLLKKVGDDYQELVENILRQKTFEIVSDFIGRELDTDAGSFKDHIENSAKGLITESNNFFLELNQTDLSILQKYFASEENKFTLLEGAELRRGEFRIISGSSGIEQILEAETL